MVLTRAVKLMELYAVCPKCGNDKIGNNQGNLIVDDDVFERTCKCGFSARVEEKFGIQKKEIDERIEREVHEATTSTDVVKGKTIVSLKEAADITGMSEWSLRTGFLSGKFPGIRCGEKKGRIVFDINLLTKRLEELMLENMDE